MFLQIKSDSSLILGGIQQLRGQEEGGGSLECPHGQKPSYFTLLCTVMGGEKEKGLH